MPTAKRMSADLDFGHSLADKFGGFLILDGDKTSSIFPRSPEDFVGYQFALENFLQNSAVEEKKEKPKEDSAEVSAKPEELDSARAAQTLDATRKAADVVSKTEEVLAEAEKLLASQDPDDQAEKPVANQTPNETPIENYE